MVDAYIPLVDDSTVPIFELSLSMKRKDLSDYEVVFALYTICVCVDLMIDEIEESDLPEMFRDGYRSVRSSLSELRGSLEQYRDEKGEILLSACED